MKGHLRLLSLAAIWLTLVSVVKTAEAAAEDSCKPWQPKIHRGLVLRAALGSSFWAGEIGENSQPGLVFTFGAGYEFLSWLAVEASWFSSLHDTNQPFPPAGGSFTTQGAHGGVRLGLPMGAFDIFLRGGVGILWTRPNILVRLEAFNNDLKFSWLSGAGFSWHTPRRHVWIGLESNVIGGIDKLPGILIDVSAVLGMTF